MTLQTRWNARQSRRWLRTCTQVGEAPHLVGRPTINVEDGSLLVGDRFRLASTPVPSHLIAGPGATLEIGSDVAIGHGAAIAAYERIRIGNGTHIGPFVIIMDTNFHGASGDQSLHHDCRPVLIGDGCRIGSRVTITRGVTIGDGAEILAGSVVSSSIPPGVCAAGARARIIGHAGDLMSRWDSAAAALPELLMASLDLGSAPDLDATGIPEHLLTHTRMLQVLQAIEDGLGVVLDRSVVPDLRSFADIAAAVMKAERGRRATGA